MKLNFKLQVIEPDIDPTTYPHLNGKCSPSCPYLNIVDDLDYNAFCEYTGVGLSYYDYYLAECTTTTPIEDHNIRVFKPIIRRHE